MRFSIAPPEKSTFTEAFELSPNGQTLAFVARGSSGETSLWVRPISAIDARQLPGTEGASFPFWSPDSRSIGFFSGGKLRKIDAAGGPAQTLADASTDPRGGTWMPDGTIIFSPETTTPLLRIAASGGAVSSLTKLDADVGQSSHRWPSLLPDGKHFLYFGRGGTTDKQGLYAGSTDSSEPVLIVSTPVAGRYAEVDGTGYLLFVREGTLMVQRFDAAKAHFIRRSTAAR
jgi:Tol biopolymer transport system component